MAEQDNCFLVSVIMPVYNAGEFLRPALQSILDQTYQNWELVIIDDGSTDGYIANNNDLIFSDTRISYVFQKNTGRPGALNHGLKIIRGEFWMIQDADDISYPKRIEEQVKALITNKDVAAVYCNNDIILPDNRTFAPGCSGKDAVECQMLIQEGNIPAHDATGLYRTKTVSGYYFDEEMWLIEGIDFVMRIGERFPICVIPDCLYGHRVNYSSITHSRADKIEEATLRFKKKMLSRRGQDEGRLGNVKSNRVKKHFKHRNCDTVLPYAMNSVFQQRVSGNWREAIRTAFVCIGLHPFDWLYYKPLMYCMAPLSFIKFYRTCKHK